MPSKRRRKISVSVEPTDEPSNQKQQVENASSNAEEDSRENSQLKLEWLLSPISPSVFFDEYWEKKPLLIRRSSDRQHYGDLFSQTAIPELLGTGRLTYERDIDITEYRDGRRSTYNGKGSVSPSEVSQV